MSQVRPFYWSVRRELWENRSVFIAPMAAAGVALFGFLVGSFGWAASVRRALANPGSARAAVPFEAPFSSAVMAVLVISWIVAVFYCLAALQGERRDRSILFWKSLPVSDLTTVLAKAAIPMVVIPVVVLAVAVSTQLVMLLWGSVILMLNNIAPWVLWRNVPLPWNALVLGYVLICVTLWSAPIWAWLLLVSGWARRMAFLWAVGPPLAALIFVRMAFNSNEAFGRFLAYRFVGGITQAFAEGKKGAPDFEHIDPIRFLTSPGLWTGLIFAAAFLAAAVWLRRRREPI